MMGPSVSVGLCRWATPRVVGSGMGPGYQGGGVCSRQPCLSSAPQSAQNIQPSRGGPEERRGNLSTVPASQVEKG